MERKYNYYLFASVILLIIAFSLYIINNRQVKTAPEVIKSVEISEDHNPVGLVEGKSTDSYDPNMLPADTPLTANKFVVADGIASYTAIKKIVKKPQDTIIGTTDNVSGLGWYDKTSKTGALYLEMNMSDFKSDSSTMDNDVLDKFEYTEITVTGSFNNLDLAEGIVGTINVPVYLSINGVQKSVNFDVVADVRDTKLNATGNAEINLSDFGVVPPSLLGVFEVENKIKITFDIDAISVD